MAGDQDYKIDRKKKGPSFGAKVGITAMVLGVTGTGVYPMLFPGKKDSLDTSVTEEFQQSETGAGFGRIESNQSDAGPVFDVGPLTAEMDAQRAALEARNAVLADEVARLRDALTKIGDEAGAGVAQQLAAAMRAAQEQNAEALALVQKEFEQRMATAAAEAAKREREQREFLAQLEAQNAGLQAQIAAGLSRPVVDEEAERARRLEEQRIAELQAARTEQEALLKLRIRSEAVVYDAGSSAGSGEPPSSGGPSGPGANASRDARARDFVETGAESADVQQAEIIANPANTVLQGTMIEATLENAVDSSLPGTVSAIVNHPVSSFDGAQILIPPGSVLFGRYSSDISLGQKRILVSWTRLVTPEGQSVQMSAYGGDEQGRSGITGRVNTKFAARFGGAALISLIGAAPAIAAAQIEDPTTSDLAGQVGKDLSDATDSVIEQYATLPPIIRLEPGAQVTVMVDRDLEFF